MEKYKIGSKLGDGAFGSVMKGINEKTGRVVAIKKMKKLYSTWDECQSMNEIKVLKDLHHPNIINLYQLIKYKNEVYMVFQYMTKNVYQMIQEGGLKEVQIRNIIYQTMQGLSYMHRQGYFHRDLKPENLLERDGVIKIADLGLARQIRAKPPFTQYVSTRWYRAPEVILRSPHYNSPMDMFALGLIMAELYTSAPLCPGSSEKDQLYKIFQITGTPSKEQWPDGYKLAANLHIELPICQPSNLYQLIPNASQDAINLIQSMINLNPNKRPTALQALHHQYFQVKMPTSKPKIINQQNQYHENEQWSQNIKYKPGYVCKMQ